MVLKDLSFNLGLLFHSGSGIGGGAQRVSVAIYHIDELPKSAEILSVEVKDEPW
jgi:hypothetical protein